MTSTFCAGRSPSFMTVALHAVASVQRAGGIAAFIDAEHALDPVYAQKLPPVPRATSRAIEPVGMTSTFCAGRSPSFMTEPLPESSGKTTVALHAVASVQRAGGIAAFIDAEHALDPSRWG
jgi:hypothetical protein